VLSWQSPDKQKNPRPKRGTEVQFARPRYHPHWRPSPPTRHVRAGSSNRYTAPDNGGDTGDVYSMTEAIFGIAAPGSIPRPIRARLTPSPARFAFRVRRVLAPFEANALFDYSNLATGRTECQDDLRLPLQVTISEHCPQPVASLAMASSRSNTLFEGECDLPLLESRSALQFSCTG
jgi:hypothetical protein